MKTKVENRRIIIIIIASVMFVAVCVWGIIIGAVDRFYMNDFFKGWRTNTSLPIEDTVISASEDNRLAIYNGRRYYVVSEPTGNKFTWTLYSCALSGSDKVAHGSLNAEKEFRNVTQRLYRNMDAPYCGGYYYNDQIVLRSVTKALVYELKSGDLSEYVAQDYAWPKTNFYVDLDSNSNQLIIVNRETGEGKAYSDKELLSFCEQHDKFEKLAFEKTKTNHDRLKSFPSDVFVFDDKIYVTAAVLNKNGFVIGVTFEFDPETESFNYVHHSMVGGEYQIRYALAPVVK